MSTVFRHMTGSGSKGANDSQSSGVSGKARPAHLCYVDDSRTSAYVVKRMLKPYGYQVDHFDSAEPALIALIESDYDLLLTDLKVSPKGMDGDDLVRTLRASGHGKISSMPVIVITGATDTNVLSQVYEAGANQIMTKPVNGEELDAHIRKLVYKNKPDGDDVEDKTSAVDTGPEKTAMTATVVPFGQEHKVKGITVTEIPVLSQADYDKFSKYQDDDDSRRVLSEDSDGAKPVPKPTNRVKPAPRVTPTLNPVKPDIPSAVKSTAELAGKLANQVGAGKLPVGKAKPNSNVGVQPRPTISNKINPTNNGNSAKPSATANRAGGNVNNGAGSQQGRVTAAMARQAAMRAAAKAKNASTLNVQIPAAKQKQATTGNVKKPIVDPAALKKVKAAAAAKKAKLIEQHKAKLAQQAAQAKAKSVQKKLQPEVELTLEPKETEPLNVFNKGSAAKADFNNNTVPRQPKTGTASNSFSNTGNQPNSAAPGNHGSAAANKAAPPPNSNDGFVANAARAAATGHNRPQDSLHTADLFGQSAGFGNHHAGNVMQQMDQFPLVQTDYRDAPGGEGGLLSIVSSIVELWGPKKVLMAVVAVAVLAFFYNSWSGLFSEGVTVQTTTVQQGEIFQSITVPGKVVSKLRVDLTPSIAGRLTNVYVEEGDKVKKGELLARLDDREAKSNLKRAEANARNAEEDVALAERSLKRLRQAFSKGAVARQLVEEAEVELRSAKARDSVAKEEVRTAKLSLENPRIVAPFSGTITARYVEIGQWVVPSETLFSLVDQSQREIEVRVDAADSGGIAVGQTVTLSSDAFPGLEWPESVTRLAAATSNVGNANTVSVYISLGSNAPSLRFGQQVDAEIRTAWNPSALKVPYGAIINREGRPYVAVVENNFVTLVEVETGIEDFSHIEIREGISVGQQIILNATEIEEGDRVIFSDNN